MDLTQPKAVVLETKRKLRAAPQGSAGPVLDLIGENGQVLLTIAQYWDRDTRGRRNADNELQYEFRVADLQGGAGMPDAMALVKQLRESQGAAVSIFQRKRVVRPKVGESQIWLLYGIEPDFTAEARFRAP